MLFVVPFFITVGKVISQPLVRFPECIILSFRATVYCQGCFTWESLQFTVYTVSTLRWTKKFRHNSFTGQQAQPVQLNSLIKSITGSIYPGREKNPP